MLLELKGFILLKVFSSDVQSVFPFDISYASLYLNENYKVFPFNHPFFIYSVNYEIMKEESYLLELQLSFSI